MAREWIPLWLKLLVRRAPPTSSPNRFIFPSPVRRQPYVVEVHDLLDDILRDDAALDHVGNIYIERIAYYKRSAYAQREFLVFTVRDKTDSSRKNIALLDRIPEKRPSAYPTVEGAAQEVADDLEQGSPSPLEAGDHFAMPVSNNLRALCDYRRLRVHSPEYVHDIRHQELTIEMVIVLACVVSAHDPEYTLDQNQRYWYTDTVWTIVCRLAGINDSNRRNWRTKISLGMPVQPCTVSEASRPDALHQEFQKHWTSFLADVRDRQARGLAAQIKAVNERIKKVTEAQRRAKIQAALEKAETAIEEAKAIIKEAYAAAGVDIEEVEVELEELHPQVEGPGMESSSK
ncbi:hypothetical protein FRC10_011976 [Ceratobasidium sp. 414]|nr:hypothetical protein FRC10_011976 [Ceratobasidium sp. 414]